MILWAFVWYRCALQFMWYSFMNLKNKDLIGYFLHLSIKICNWNSFSQKKPRCGKRYAIIFGPSHNDHLAVKNNNIWNSILSLMYYRPNDLCFENTISFCSTSFIKSHPFYLRLLSQYQYLFLMWNTCSINTQQSIINSTEPSHFSFIIIDVLILLLDKYIY